MSTTTEQQHSIILPDNRRLGYSDLGDPQGYPVFYFHGTPGSRLEFSAEDTVIQIPGFRFLCPERPGYGLSDPKPDRTLVDWPEDVAALADHLKLDTFTVMGASGGGPHALACGYALPRRVNMVCLFGSPSPAGIKGGTKGMAFGNKIAIWVSRLFPGIIRKGIRLYADSFHKQPDKFLAGLTSQLSAPDKQLIEDEAVQQAVLRDFSEAYRQGSEGHVTDAMLTVPSRSWGFEMEEVQVPVHLWHGELDTLVSMSMAEFLATSLPRCKARFVTGSGHFLLEHPAVVKEVAEVLSSSFEV